MARIVVVDDEKDFRDLVTQILSAAGHEVAAVDDPARGLEALRAHRAELAILDVNMPGMTGYDLCREIRRDPALARLPVMFLTVQARTPDQKAGLEAGGDEYLGKPFRPDELRARVFALLRRASPRP